MKTRTSGAEAREPALHDSLVDATKGEDVAILLHHVRHARRYPKLAMLAAGRVLAALRRFISVLLDPGRGPEDEYVSVLPLPWILEQIYVLGSGLLCRMKVNFFEATPRPC